MASTLTRLVKVAQSKHLSKNLDPLWEAVAVEASLLANTREIKVEIY